MAEPSILQRLLGDTSTASFFEQHYLKLPFSRAGGCAEFQAIADWGVLDELLSQPDTDILVGRAGQSLPEARPTSLADARRYLQDGQTIGVRHAHVHDAALADVAHQFSLAFLAPVDVHLYCTPAGQPGFGWHYDAEEVFVLQTAGSKEWSLRKNTVHPWPLMEAIPTDQQYEREIMPLIRCQLAAGDWLYIPGGYWHSTRVTADSLSLSIGIRAATALDVYDFLRPWLVESLQWRQRLSVLTSPSAGKNEVADVDREVFRELGADLARLFNGDELIRAFRDSQKSVPNSQS